MTTLSCWTWLSLTKSLLRNLQLRNARTGLKLLPEANFANHAAVDVLAVPGGISASIDMLLHLVATLVSRKLAPCTAHQMEYAWNVNA